MNTIFLRIIYSCVCPNLLSVDPPSDRDTSRVVLRSHELKKPFVVTICREYCDFVFNFK